METLEESETGEGEGGVDPSATRGQETGGTRKEIYNLRGFKKTKGFERRRF